LSGSIKEITGRKAVQPISAKGFEHPVQAQLVEGKRT